ncbi:hypothetical protein [Planomicrobium sp. CPCC 101110]|uniref:hypothetical protein n=1 Tax=Planomicrobium sp. CPCC 101110 TaxID=2599619 RepID=UPI0011B44A5D|nr:hypothetical protein [Planomicrobium sp. CPCC 101110]TWT28236.1 hypothetical protein FQV30_06970 [Planomicrobium sp. CPCC 101110]
MKLEHIKEILQTVSFYNTVDITQTFSKEDTDHIIVKSVKNTGVLQMTFIQTGQVVFYQSIDQAAEAVEGNLNSSTLM